MDHIEANNIVTMKSLETNRTPDVIGSVIDRFNDVIDMVSPYLDKDMQVLDLGTKDCLFFDVLLKKGFSKENFVGIDCCPEVVRLCLNKGYDTIMVDIQEMSTEDFNFDFIFAIHTLEHVPNPVVVIEKCIEMLNPYGFLFIEVPIQSQIDDPELWGHFSPFVSKNQLKKLIEKDFNIIKENSQKTPSKSPWYRILIQKK